MKLPKIKLKKAPYYLTLGLLTSGASVILGFLSFGGMLALSSVLPFVLPALPLAVAAFALSVGYEGEIYLQNIKGALNKLFKHNYMKRRLANEYLLAFFTDSNFDINLADCPQFFKDYAAQCRLLIQFENKTLNKEGAKRKKQEEKKLNDMEKWFARQLISENERHGLAGDDYRKELQSWLMSPPAQLVGLRQSVAISRFQAWETKFKFFKLFSSLSALFMGLGTTYLLGEAIGAIPWMLSAATLPFLIVPMSVIAGLAYGLLTYNAITDMLTNNKIRTMYLKLKENLSRDNWTWHDVTMAATGIALGGLAILLTACTAGTWWTIAKNTKPLFTWMGKLPNVVMGIINPAITGISALVFNMQNSAESLEIIAESTEPALTGHDQPSFLQRLNDAFVRLNEKESPLQIINPFRLFLKLTIAPLRVLLFLGHLISIGLTADRMPGVPEIVSALLGIVSEGFEDFHYFVGHGHGGCEHHHEISLKLFIKKRLSLDHSHNHDADLPTRILLLIFSPIYRLAALWDWGFSREPVTFERALDKQYGVSPKEQEESVDLSQQPQPSAKWQVEHAVYRIERHKEKQLSGVLINKGLAHKKKEALTVLQDKLLDSINTADSASVQNCIMSESLELYNQHRFFCSVDRSETNTSQFLNELPARVCMI